jgi:hypothetical protein
VGWAKRNPERPASLSIVPGFRFAQSGLQQRFPDFGTLVIGPASSGRARWLNPG